MRALADIESLVSRLGAVLQQSGPGATDRDLADEYAEACISINERLSQCSRMIDEGSSMQALMLSEEKPNLLDSVAALSFAKSTEWHEACALNGLRLAPKLDRSAVHKVNELYTKGNRSEQTKALYKQFRAAMAARDDASALASISAIASLDPTDADAGKELARLERKRREDSLRALKDALQNSNDAAVLSLLEDCHRLGITDAVEVGSAMQVRHRVLADEARQKIGEIIPALSDLQMQGRWQQCGERASKVTSLAAMYGLSLSPEESAAVASATSFFESYRQQSMHKARFNESVAALSDCADRIQRNEKTSAKKLLDAIEDERLRLKKAYEKAKDFTLPLPEKLVERVGQVASSLDGEIERLKRARKVRNIAIGTTLVLLLTVSGVGGYFFIRAGQFAGELRTLVSEKKAIPLRDLVSQVEAKYSAYLSAPSLKSALFEAKAWLEGVSSQSLAADSAIAKALEIAATDFAKQSPEYASAVFNQAREAIDKLPGDLASTVRPRLSEAEGKLTIWLGAMRDDRVVATKKKIEEARGMLAGLDAADAVDQLKLAFAPALEAVDSLLGAAGSQVEQMSLPAAMKAEISDMAARVERTAGALSSYESALSSISSAKTTEEYAKAVEQMSQVELPRVSEVKAAQLMATKKLDAHQFLGAMLLPATPELWVSVKQTSDLEKVPKPELTRESEVDILRDLINNENLVGIYEATIQDYDRSSGSSGRKVFTRGSLPISDQGGRVTGTSGMVYDPALSSSQLSFQQQAFVYTESPTTGAQSGKRVEAQKESDASQAMQRFGLKQLVSSDASKYSQNILAAMDKVAASREAPALVKAFVLQELAKIAKSRPNDWGLAWVPSLDSDLEQMRSQAGGAIESGDWMIPAKSSVSRSLSNWFKGREGMSYVTQQKMNMKLAKSALEAGLVICGYVGTDGRFVETEESAKGNADVLWGLDSSSGTPAVVFAKSGDSSEAEFVPKQKARPLSPVFVLPIDRNEVVAATFKAADVPDDLKEDYLSGFPPVFATEPKSSAGAAQ
jgi:hypothetical protein